VCQFDLLNAVGELHIALVLSSKANARLVNVDASAALTMPGVIGFLNHTSVPGSNLTGVANVEEIFATTQVGTCVPAVQYAADQSSEIMKFSSE